MDIFVSYLLFMFWCSLVLFSIGFSCILLRSRRLYLALNHPGMTNTDILVFRSTHLSSEKL